MGEFIAVINSKPLQGVNMQKLRSSFVHNPLLVVVCLIVASVVGATHVLAGSDSPKQEFTAEVFAERLFKVCGMRVIDRPLYRSIPEMHLKSFSYGEGFIVTKRGTVEIPGIVFELNEFKFCEESDYYIQELAKAITTYYSRTRILIVGHTDNIGTESYNFWLSEKRAQAVVDALVIRGIDRSQLQTQGRGEDSPLLPNDSDENRTYNRRISITTAGAY